MSGYGEVNYAAITEGRHRMASFWRAEKRKADHDYGKHKRDRFPDCLHCVLLMSDSLYHVCDSLRPEDDVPPGFRR